MRSNTRIQAIACCCTLAAFSWLTVFEQSVAASDDSVPLKYRPVVGEPHPDFILPGTEDDKPRRLSDYRGKKVLLVHFASW